MLPKCPFRNKRKRSTRIDFTHRTFAEKGGAEKGSYTKEKGPAVLTLHTGLLLKKKGGVGWNTHMRTLNNTEWGAGLWRCFYLYFFL